MPQNSRSGFPHAFGYARLSFAAGTPLYGGPVGYPIAWGIFATGVAPIDNGVGDTTFTLTEPVDNDSVSVGIAFRESVGADPRWLRSAGYTLPTPTTLRVTTVVQPTNAGVTALADALVDITIFRKVPTLLNT
jgi:hypothetical protein